VGLLSTEPHAQPRAVCLEGALARPCTFCKGNGRREEREKKGKKEKRRLVVEHVDSLVVENENGLNVVTE